MNLILFLLLLLCGAGACRPEPHQKEPALADTKVCQMLTPAEYQLLRDSFDIVEKEKRKQEEAARQQEEFKRLLKRNADRLAMMASALEEYIIIQDTMIAKMNRGAPLEWCWWIYATEIDDSLHFGRVTWIKNKFEEDLKRRGWRLEYWHDYGPNAYKAHLVSWKVIPREGL